MERCLGPTPCKPVILVQQTRAAAAEPCCRCDVQVTDGAAAVMLMTRREARRRNLPILGIFRSFAAVGVPPSVMGIGPAYAIPEALRMAGLSVDDIDVYEINEAFASQVRRRGCSGLQRPAREPPLPPPRSLHSSVLTAPTPYCCEPPATFLPPQPAGGACTLPS